MKHFYLILVVAVSIRAAPPSGRIFGGKSATPGQFPFIVALKDTDQFCDGSIINEKWVVTAGHCVDFVTPNATVLAGTNLLHEGGQEYKVSRWIKHEDFDYSNGNNDIGLIEIDGKFIFNDLLRPVEFGDPEDNASCLVAGWGATAAAYPEELQFVEINVLGLEKCEKYNFQHMHLGPEQVCTLGPMGKGTCFGDSGGPLVCEGKLAGILFFSTLPCAIGLPDVYTRPSIYANWIKQQIQK